MARERVRQAVASPAKRAVKKSRKQEQPRVSGGPKLREQSETQKGSQMVHQRAHQKGSQRDCNRLNKARSRAAYLREGRATGSRVH